MHSLGQSDRCPLIGQKSPWKKPQISVSERHQGKSGRRGKKRQLSVRETPRQAGNLHRIVSNPSPASHSSPSEPPEPGSEVGGTQRWARHSLSTPSREGKVSGVEIFLFEMGCQLYLERVIHNMIWTSSEENSGRTKRKEKPKLIKTQGHSWNPQGNSGTLLEPPGTLRYTHEHS